MAKKRDFQSRLAEYKKLAAAAEAHEGELPSLASFRVDLEKAVEEIESTKERQENLEQLRLEATQELWDHVAAGQDASVRLKLFVRILVGRDKERLAAFGIDLGGRRPELYARKERRKGSPGYH